MLPDVVIDHCVIAVSSWERSNAFYRDVVGAVVVELGSAGTSTALVISTSACTARAQSRCLTARDPARPGNSDLCFEWPGTIDDAVAHLAAHGSRSRPDRLTREARSVVTASTCTSAIPTEACSSSSPTASWRRGVSIVAFRAAVEIDSPGCGAAPGYTHGRQTPCCRCVTRGVRPARPSRRPRRAAPGRGTGTPPRHRGGPRTCGRSATR